MSDEKKIPEGTGVPPIPEATEGYGSGGYGEKAHGKEGYGAGGYGEKAHGKEGYGAGGYGEKAHGKEGYGAGRPGFGGPQGRLPMGQQIQWMPVVVYIPVYAGQQPGFPMGMPGMGMPGFGGPQGRPPMGPPQMMQPPMGRMPAPPWAKEGYGAGGYGEKHHKKESCGEKGVEETEE